MPPPVMLRLPKRTAMQMQRRAGLEPMAHRWPQAAVRVDPEGLIGRDTDHYPLETLSGADETPARERAINIQFYKDGPGKYRGVALVPLTLRDKRTGAPRRVLVTVELRANIDDEAAVGADIASSVTQSMLVPVLEGVSNVLNNPLAALAACATVLIPGLGPAYLASYAIGQSLVDYGLKKARE